MMKWLSTPFDYDLYQGIMPPQCPHCKGLLEHVNEKVHSRLRWSKEKKEFEEDGNSVFEYTCYHCKKEIKNIGIEDELVFYRNKGEEPK